MGIVKKFEPAAAVSSGSPLTSSAKIHPPLQNTFILERRRLFELIDNNIQHRHLWITGLPGAGKSVLASSYTRKLEMPSPWYVIDSLDSDPAIFLPFFVAAFAAVFPEAGFGTLHQGISPDELENISFSGRKFFRRLFGVIPERFVLVLDNCQEVGDDSLLNRLMALCIQEMPYDSRIIFLSRTTPPPSLVSYVINEKLEVIQPEALNFDNKEIRDIAELYIPDCNDLRFMKWLRSITSGWAAGITLILKNSHRAYVPDSGVMSIRGDLFNYFANLLLSDFSSDEKQLLMAAAIFPDIRPAVAASIAGITSEILIFRDISQKNLFTYTLDEKEELFLFHPLFREFLLAHAREFMPVQEFRTLNLDAAAILFEQGRAVEAVELLNSALLWHESARIIKKIGTDMLKSGKFRTLANWHAVMPEQVFDKEPELLLLFGNALIAFDTKLSISVLQRAFDIFSKNNNDRTGALLACAALSNAIINYMSDLSLLDPLIDYMDSELDPEKLPSKSGFENEIIVNAIFRALVLRRPTHNALEKWLQVVLELGGLHPAIITHYLWTGCFARARAVIDHIYSARNHISSKLMLSAIQAMETQYYLIMDDEKQCCRVMDEALQLIEETGIRVWKDHFIILCAGCCINNGNIRKARSFLEKIEPSINNSRLLEQSYYHVVKTVEALYLDDIVAAETHEQTALMLAEHIGMPSYTMWCNCNSAMVAVVQNNQNRAEEFFARVLAMSASPGNPWFSAFAHLGLAWLYIRKENADMARKHLEQGFSIARINQYIAFFFYNKEMMEAITVKALEYDIESEFVRHFVRRKRIIPENPPVYLKNWPWPVKIYTLGRFSILVDEKKIQDSGLSQNRPVKLLQAIIAAGARQVSKSRLADLFWSESEGDHQMAALKMTVHRLRSLLGYRKAIIQTTDYLSIDSRYCWVDVWQFQRLAGEVLKKHPGDMEARKQAARKAISVYQGPFLQAWEDVSWTFAHREKLQKLHSAVQEYL